MKKYLLILLLLSTGFSQGSNSWQILHNGKQLFAATSENEEKNLLRLTIADFTPAAYFAISFTERDNAASRRKWTRTIAVYDEKDNELCRKDSSLVKISSAELEKMLRENKVIKIYTWSLPKDPAEAARIRIRRVHLCTIVLS